MTLTEHAKDFSHRAHDAINQKRKYSGAPYWVHTDAVAQTVTDIGGTPEMIAAAHLHDYREDVVTKLQEENRLSELVAFEFEYMVFPQVVRDMVNDLTDVYVKSAYPDKNRRERHDLENERLSKISVDAKTIKLADLIDNTKSIVAEDTDFAKVYLKEKFAVLPLLSDGNPKLLQQASMQTIAGFSSLGLTIPMVSAH